jgi:hypothetical protein
MVIIYIQTYYYPYLGDFYRRICSRAGAAVAIVATARKLAVIYYNMMSSKQKYNPQDLIEFQKKYKEMKIKRLEKSLDKLNPHCSSYQNDG